jgi:hypothetical protein
VLESETGIDGIFQIIGTLFKTYACQPQCNLEFRITMESDLHVNNIFSLSALFNILKCIRQSPRLLNLKIICTLRSHWNIILHYSNGHMQLCVWVWSIRVLLVHSDPQL